MFSCFLWLINRVAMGQSTRGFFFFVVFVSPDADLHAANFESCNLLCLFTKSATEGATEIVSLLWVKQIFVWFYLSVGFKEEI